MMTSKLLTPIRSRARCLAVALLTAAGTLGMTLPAGAQDDSFTTADLEDLLKSVPELKAAAEVIPLARSSPPLSTREERSLRRELADDLDISDKDARAVSGTEPYW